MPITLEGWYADTGCVERATADRIVSENVTFYAYWVESTGGGDEPSGFTFDGWFCGDEKLQADTAIAAEEKVVGLQIDRNDVLLGDALFE